MIPVHIPGKPKARPADDGELPEGFLDSDTKCMFYDPELGDTVVYKIIHVDGTETILRSDLDEIVRAKRNKEAIPMNNNKNTGSTEPKGNGAASSEPKVTSNEDLAKRLDRIETYIAKERPTLTEQVEGLTRRVQGLNHRIVLMEAAPNPKTKETNVDILSVDILADLIVAVAERL